MNNPISTELEQFIIASILGDGHIRPSANRKKARIAYSHSKAQKEYIFWKYEFLKEYGLSVSPPRHIYVGDRKQFEQYRFTTKTDEIFMKYYDMLYETSKKKLTRKALNKLGALGLAIWYMDDGNLSLQKYTKTDGTRGIHSRRLMLNTQGFSYEENQLIQRYFKVVWDIDTTINRDKSYYRITMGAISANKLIEIIEPYIQPELYYKIDMQYKRK